MIQWEYITTVFKTTREPGSKGEQEYLSEHGKTGWELCAVVNDLYLGRVYYFKRQIIENK